METIKLKNNNMFNVTWCGVADGFLNTELIDVHDVVEAVQIFSDTENTSEIVYEYVPGMSETYTGYTELIMVRKNMMDGYVTVVLKRGEDNV